LVSELLSSAALAGHLGRGGDRVSRSVSSSSVEFDASRKGLTTPAGVRASAGELITHVLRAALIAAHQVDEGSLSRAARAVYDTPSAGHELTTAGDTFDIESLTSSAVMPGVARLPHAAAPVSNCPASEVSAARAAAHSFVDRSALSFGASAARLDASDPTAQSVFGFSSNDAHVAAAHAFVKHLFDHLDLEHRLHSDVEDPRGRSAPSLVLSPEGLETTDVLRLPAHEFVSRVPRQLLADLDGALQIPTAESSEVSGMLEAVSAASSAAAATFVGSLIADAVSRPPSGPPLGRLRAPTHQHLSGRVVSRRRLVQASRDILEFSLPIPYARTAEVSGLLRAPSDVHRQAAHSFVARLFDHLEDTSGAALQRDLEPAGQTQQSSSGATAGAASTVGRVDSMAVRTAARSFVLRLFDHLEREARFADEAEEFARSSGLNAPAEFNALAVAQSFAARSLTRAGLVEDASGASAATLEAAQRRAAASFVRGTLLPMMMASASNATAGSPPFKFAASSSAGAAGSLDPVTRGAAASFVRATFAPLLEELESAADAGDPLTMPAVRGRHAVSSSSAAVSGASAGTLDAASRRAVASFVRAALAPMMVDEADNDTREVGSAAVAYAESDAMAAARSAANAAASSNLAGDQGSSSAGGAHDAATRRAAASFVRTALAPLLHQSSAAAAGSAVAEASPSSASAGTLDATTRRVAASFVRNMFAYLDANAGHSTPPTHTHSAPTVSSSSAAASAATSFVPAPTAVRSFWLSRSTVTSAACAAQVTPPVSRPSTAGAAAAAWNARRLAACAFVDAVIGAAEEAIVSPVEPLGGHPQDAGSAGTVEAAPLDGKTGAVLVVRQPDVEHAHATLRALVAALLVLGYA
jgi:hypothetical protein